MEVDKSHVLLGDSDLWGGTWSPKEEREEKQESGFQRQGPNGQKLLELEAKRPFSLSSQGVLAWSPGG